MFWSLWLNKHWPANKNDTLIHFNFVLVVLTHVLKGHGFASLFVPFSFLNYLKLLLPGILTLFLIAGCNFKCITSKNIPKPTLAAIKPTSLCIFMQLLTKSGFGCKFGERFQKRHLTILHKLPSPNNMQFLHFLVFDPLLWMFDGKELLLEVNCTLTWFLPNLKIWYLHFTIYPTWIFHAIRVIWPFSPDFYLKRENRNANLTVSTNFFVKDNVYHDVPGLLWK